MNHEGKIIPLSFLHTQDSETGHRDPDDATACYLPPQLLLSKMLYRDGSKLIFGGAFEGHWNYYLLDIAGQQATQLTDGPGDNTFGGFLSADDRPLWYVKTTSSCAAWIWPRWRSRWCIRWMTNGWPTGPGSPIAIAARWWVSRSCDWQPLTDWGKFRAFYFTEPGAG